MLYISVYTSDQFPKVSCTYMLYINVQPPNSLLKSRVHVTYIIVDTADQSPEASCRYVNERTNTSVNAQIHQ